MLGYGFRDLRKTLTSYNGQLKFLNQVTPSYGKDIDLLNFEIVNVSENCVKVNIGNANIKKGQSVPDRAFQRPAFRPVRFTNSNFNVSVDTINRNFYITRKNDDSNPIFGFSLASMVYKEKYIEVNVEVPNNANIYGFGEVVDTFRRNPNNSTTTLFSRDCPCVPKENLYGSHPYYMEVRDGKAHGVLLLNSHGLDVVLTPENISYRVLGGNLEFYVFIGPTPMDVCRQYINFIGKPVLPPYWSLGFHQCRFGYENINTLKEVVKKYNENRLPLDCIWADIDYMENFKDFTFSEKRFPSNEMKKFIEKLHENNKRIVGIIDPGIPLDVNYPAYVSGCEKDIWIKIKAQLNKENEIEEDEDGDTPMSSSSTEVVEIPFIGQVWPGRTLFPDFFNPNTQEWWKECFSTLLNNVPFDGIWIDMNEIANFTNGFCFKQIDTEDWSDRKTGLNRYLNKCSRQIKKIASSIFNPKDEEYEGPIPIYGDEDCPLDNPPYMINNGRNHLPLNNKTISMGATHYDGIKEYDVHNVFGHMESIATYKALTEIDSNKRPFILSRSTFVGSGAFVAHWLGDNQSTWESMESSIAGMLNFQLFGIPMVGADICGFNGDADEELCCRWMQLGSFYPFARNHNGIRQKSQEPYCSKLLCEVSRKALQMRYELLPYWYTLFYYANSKGEPVIRSLWMEFINDEETLIIENQFLVGSGLMVSPVLKQKDTTVKAYIPKSAIFYSWTTGHQLNKAKDSGNYFILNAPIDTIPVHIRGGAIIPTQCFGLTTVESRTKPFSLVVALDENKRAYGSLYLDDGYSLDIKKNYSLIEFKFEDYCLSCIPKFAGYKTMAHIEAIKIYGISFESYFPELHFDTPIGNRPDITYDSDENVVIITSFSLDVNKEWSLNLARL